MQRVIPIVGPDLLNVEVDGSRILLDRYIAKHLACKLSLPANLLSAEPSLNEIVCHFLAAIRPPPAPLHHRP